MTMSLARGLTTLNTNKKKGKNTKPITATRARELELEWRKHNKEMRRKHMHDMVFSSFDDYVAYRHGTHNKISARRDRDDTFREYHGVRKSYRRVTEEIPSMDTGACNTFAKPKKRYTGTLVKGVSQMHKSNAVPVINDQEIVDIGHMRR